MPWPKKPPIDEISGLGWTANRCYLIRDRELRFRCFQRVVLVYPNEAKAAGFQKPGDAVISYRNPLIPPTAGQDLKSSGFPRCFQGKQHGKIDPIRRIHEWDILK